MRIIELVMKYGKSWSKISKVLGTRNGKQIRDRFINVLDPEIKKGKFNEDEDVKLVLLFKQYGPKWATIAKYYPNRTADMIKNRFHSSIKKKLSGDFNESCFYDGEEMEFDNKMEQTLMYSGKESTDESTGGKVSYSQNSYKQQSISSELINEEDSEMINEESSLPRNEEEVEYSGYNYDLLSDANNDIIGNQAINHHSFIWNFEDYFTI